MIDTTAILSVAAVIADVHIKKSLKEHFFMFAMQ
jgi:hypothetical protein